jgi:hypothetical protein
LLGHVFNLGAHYAKICSAVTDEAKHQVEDWLCEDVSAIVLDQKALQRVVVERLVAEVEILIADVGEHRRLTVDDVLTSLCC